MPDASYEFTRDGWPIAACLHGFAQVHRRRDRLPRRRPPRSGTTCSPRSRHVGFCLAELADSHVRPADLEPLAPRRVLRHREGARHRHPLGAPAAPERHPARARGREPGLRPPHHRRGGRVGHAGLLDRAAPAVLRRPEARAVVLDRRRARRTPTTRTSGTPRSAACGSSASTPPSVGLPMALELYEDTYLGTADSAVRLVEEIGLDNVGLNPDVANLIRLHRPVEDWRELFAKTLPYANYLHVKNYTRDEAGRRTGRESPSTMETGLINYRQVLRDAVDRGFRGIVLMPSSTAATASACAPQPPTSAPAARLSRRLACARTTTAGSSRRRRSACTWPALHRVSPSRRTQPRRHAVRTNRYQAGRTMPP